MSFNQESWNSLISQGYTPRDTKPESSPGLFSKIWDDVKERSAKARSMFDYLNKNRSQGIRGIGEDIATGIGIAGQVAGGIGDIAGEAIIGAGKALIDDESEKEIADFVAAVGQSKPVQRFVGAWQDFEQERPFASAAISGAANIIGLTGTGAVGKAATAPLKSAAKAGIRAIGEGIEAAAPRAVQLARRVGSGVSEVAESAGSQLLAMSPQTVRNIVDGRISREAMKNLDNVSVATRAKEGINKALDDLSGLGSEYDAIRNSGQRVNIPVGGRVNVGDNTLREFSKPLTDTLTEYGLSIDEAGRITRSIDSKPFDPQTINAIQDFVDTYGKTGDIDANQFLNVRQAIDRIASWDAKDRDLAESFVQALRGKYDEIGKAQIDGLAKLDAEFSPIRQELGMLRRSFLTSKGELQDTAISRIANLTNKGREQVLERLEKYVPGITQEIHLLRAVEDIANAKNLKVGAYTKGVVAGGLAVAGNWQAGLAFFLLTHPTVAVPLLRKYGELNRAVKGAIDNILAKLDNGQALDSSDKKVIAQMMSDEQFFRQSMTSSEDGRVMRSSYGGMQDSGRRNARLTGTFDDRMDVPRVSSVDDVLLAEAKKYNNAEEFVKASGQKLFHAGPHGIKEFRTGSSGGTATFGEGIYLTPSRKTASAYSNEGKNKVYEVYADIKNPLDISKADDEEWLQFIQQSSPERKRAWLEKNGYDAVIDLEDGGNNEIMVLYPSQVKIKENLIDIWNKAHNK